MHAGCIHAPVMCVSTERQAAARGAGSARRHGSPTQPPGLQLSYSTVYQSLTVIGMVEHCFAGVRSVPRKCRNTHVRPRRDDTSYPALDTNTVFNKNESR